MNHFASATPLLFERVEAVAGNSLRRQVMMKPSSCGPGNQLVSRIGDWTWDAVSHACHTNVFDARDGEGRPSYLSFYYYHLEGDPDFHLHRPRFGEVLLVSSTCYAFGTESVLTVHRLTMPVEPAGEDAVTAEEFHGRRRPGCLYAMTVNRWVRRGQSGNVGLCAASPVDFSSGHLPAVPAAFSPRPGYDRARRNLAFDRRPGFEERAAFTFPYDVDASRDLNGAGLLYFASFFAMADKGLLAHWAFLGRDRHAFLRRKVVGQRLLYLANADPGTRLFLHFSSSAAPFAPDEEQVGVTIRDAEAGTILAIGDLLIRR